ncbi:MAG: EamA family transporter [Patescibacteria group bacterium]
MRPKHHVSLGLLGVIGIWLTAGLALPFVNVLKSQTPEQLLAMRGWLTAILAFLLLRGRVATTDKYTYLIALCVPFASLGLFKGIREWGAGPTIIIIATTPAVNFFIAWIFGKKVSTAPIICFCLMLSGIIAARWNGNFNMTGLLWSLLATATNGILYELIVRAKSSSMHRCFWGSVGIGTIGVIGSLDASWSAVNENAELRLAIIAFAFVGGFLYWLANLVAFDNLPVEVASVLAQGETLAVIIVAGILLGEKLSPLQWGGVIVALIATGYLSRWVVKSEGQKT